MSPLPLLPPHAFPCPAVGPSHGPQFLSGKAAFSTGCSSFREYLPALAWGSSQAAEGVFAPAWSHGLLRNLCSVPRAPPVPPSPALVFAGLLLTLFSSLFSGVLALS